MSARYRQAPGYRQAPVTPDGGWREEVTTASGLNLLAGIWLIIAPFVLAYGNGDPTWNDVVFGALVALFALIRIGGAYREAWLSWLNLAIGAWLFASAFWLDSSATAFWNDIVLGIVVFLLAGWSISATRGPGGGLPDDVAEQGIPEAELLPRERRFARRSRQRALR